MTPIQNRCPDCDRRPTCCASPRSPSRTDITKTWRIIGITLFALSCALVLAFVGGVL